jgi:hypothetical protein
LIPLSTVRFWRLQFRALPFVFPVYPPRVPRLAVRDSRGSPGRSKAPVGTGGNTMSSRRRWFVTVAVVVVVVGILANGAWFGSRPRTARVDAPLSAPSTDSAAGLPGGTALNIQGSGNVVELRDRAAGRSAGNAGELGKSPATTIFAAVDQAMKLLPLGAMAFNTPPPVNIDKTAKVELRVGLEQLHSELARSITVPGEIQTHDIQISNRMDAVLNVDDPDTLTITPLTPARQVVSSKAPTVWMWSIKPLKAGEHPVHLVLDAVVKIDGEVTPLNVRVFEGAIDVVITPGQRAKHFAKDNWQWLWTALLVPAGGWWWKRRENKKAEDKKPDDGPKIIPPK